MTPAHKHMIRLVVRFQNAVDATREAFAEAYDHDSEFDGGEFSGPAIDRAEDAAVARLARRFGFADEDVAYDVAANLGAVVRCPFRYPSPQDFQW